MRVVRNPIGYEDARANVTYVFSLLAAMDIQTLWRPEEWLTFPDTEFALLQVGV